MLIWLEIKWNISVFLFVLCDACFCRFSIHNFFFSFYEFILYIISSIKSLFASIQPKIFHAIGRTCCHRNWNSKLWFSLFLNVYFWAFMMIDHDRNAQSIMFAFRINKKSIYSYSHRFNSIDLLRCDCIKCNLCGQNICNPHPNNQMWNAKWKVHKIQLHICNHHYCFHWVYTFRCFNAFSMFTQNDYKSATIWPHCMREHHCVYTFRVKRKLSKNTFKHKRVFFLLFRWQWMEND